MNNPGQIQGGKALQRSVVLLFGLLLLGGDAGAAVDPNSARIAERQRLGHQQALLPDMDPGRPELFAPRRSGARAGASYRMDISRQGLYRVSQPLLIAAGMDPTRLRGSDLRLFHREHEIPIEVSSEGLWTAGDSLLFYAEARRGTHSVSNAYWLAVDDTTGVLPAGLRMPTRPGAPLPGLPEEDGYDACKILDRNLVFLPWYRPWDEAIDHGFHSVFRSDVSTQVGITTRGIQTHESARLRIRVADRDATSASQPWRYLRIYKAGILQHSLRFRGNGSTWIETDLDPTLLDEGGTILDFQLQASGSDPLFAYLDELELTYRRDLDCRGGALTFSVPEGYANRRLHGLPATGDWRLLDITDPSAPVKLEGAIPELHAGEGRDLRFGDASASPVSYYLCPDADITNVAHIYPQTFSGLERKQTRADYLILTVPALHSQAQRLATQRSAQGLRPRIVMIDDIYNTFSYGIRDPTAIRQFLGYAWHHWESPAPRYVVLLGDATYDPRNVEGGQHPELVPAALGAASFEWTARDTWYATVEEDDRLPELAIGRIPAQSAAGAQQVIDKILAYESSGPNAAWRKKVLWAADDADTAGNFKARSETLRSSYALPNGYTSQSAYLDDLSGVTVRDRILAAFASGTGLIHYMGHGLTRSWAHYGGGAYLLDTPLAQGLSNNIYPIVCAFACDTGMFQGSGDRGVTESLAETLLEQPHGAVAVISATAAALESQSAEIAHGLLSDWMQPGRRYRLGPALNAGFKRLWEFNETSSELLFYALLGDPAQVLNPVSAALSDSDGDGMPDGWESLHGLEPFRPDAWEDADEDGVLHIDEWLHQLDPMARDSDADGLLDGWELARGTLPANPDSDGDHLLDGWEVEHGLDPTTPEAAGQDADNDGLDTATEQTLGTHPLRPDSDFDGMHDGAEVADPQRDPLTWDAPLPPEDLGRDDDGDGLLLRDELMYGTDPSRADSDGDGLSDADEILLHGSDPLNPDSDHDRMPDAYEWAQGYALNIADAGRDDDNDGLNAFEEWFLNTLPYDPDSDHDGLNDGPEVKNHLTLPLDADTDNDGLNDGGEISSGADPFLKDTDADGLQDNIEVARGMDPARPDSDGDTLPDAWEYNYGTDPLRDDRSEDPDHDNLDNLTEYTEGCRPDRPDTDFDGLTDDLELLTYLTLPATSDSDGDGLRDGDEISEGTNPLNPDSDGDNMKDGYEVLYGLNPLDPGDASADPDGDLLINEDEALYVTNPFVADSDADGLSDRYEVDNGYIPRLTDRDRDGINDGDEVHLYGTHPNFRDTDGDGLTDGQEILTYGTNPLLPDEDGDGLTDPQELALGTQPGVHDSLADPDLDGLSNLREFELKTAAFDPDSDNDGINDGPEVDVHFSDPLVADSDEDGLSDGQELTVYFTDPLDPDSDGDGMPDGWEVTHLLNPLLNDTLGDPDGDGLVNREEFRLDGNPQQADSDADGLNDLQEALRTSALHLADTDGDGLPDAWEVAQGSQLLVPDSAEDPDHDGLNNGAERAQGTPPFNPDADADGMRDGDEVHAGTNPLDPNSLLRLHIQQLPDGRVQLSWPAATGKTYSIWAAPVMDSGYGNFNPIATGIPATLPTSTWTHPSNPESRLHYRVAVEH